MAGDVSVDAVMAELKERVRERLREQLLRGGASKAFEDPALFAEVEQLLTTAIDTAGQSPLILPELLGEPSRWRLDTAIKYSSHRSRLGGSIRVFTKQRLLMPILRWLFEYSQDNFERQRRVNQVLFACVQELALETVRLRRQVEARANSSTRTGEPEALSGR